MTEAPFGLPTGQGDIDRGMTNLQHAKVLPHKVHGKVVAQSVHERGGFESIHFEIEVAWGQSEEDVPDTAADE
jgi:hypothetical protein